MPNAPSLKEIRDLYSTYESEWKDCQQEAQTDRKYAAGDPWEEGEKRSRENRPCVSHDEISQYLNQYLNNLRQNKRSIKVTPEGNGATEKTAEHRQNIIRAIEYRSKAQQAYITAADNAVVGGYGFAELTTEYVSSDPDSADASSFNQEIRIKRVADPDCILIDPDFRMADASDMTRAFKVEQLTREAFARKFPHAEIKSFTADHVKEAPGWIREKYIQVAKLWWVHKQYRTLQLIETSQGPTAVFADEIKGQKGHKIISDRRIEAKEVVQYITNGVEIIEEKPWAGSYIPILGCFGKEVFLEQGGGPKRVLLSMVRLARDPQKTLAFLCSQEMEEAGLTPKVPFIGYKGQFETDSEAWEQVTKVPRAYLQVDPVIDANTGQLLPIPQRVQFSPNFQAYEIAKDGARRAIMSAMGISPLPTAAQRNNEKSGIALERISTQEAIGSFHFTDNFENFLENAGRQIDELMGPIYDTKREIPAIRNNEKPYVVLANYEQAPEGQEDNVLDTQVGNHGVTVSTGPSHQSQREAASEFVDLLVSNLQSIPPPGSVPAKILAMGVKMRDLGPTGDEIAQLLDPPNANELPPQAQQAIAAEQMKTQLLTQELQKLQFEKQAKVVDNEYDLKKQHEDNATKIAVAEISTKAQVEQERQRWVAQLERELWLQGSDHAHEYAMRQAEQAHEKEMGERSAALEAASQASDQEHEAGMQASEQAQDASLQSGQQAHEASMAEGQHSHEKEQAKASAKHESGTGKAK